MYNPCHAVNLLVVSQVVHCTSTKGDWSFCGVVNDAMWKPRDGQQQGWIKMGQAMYLLLYMAYHNMASIYYSM